MIPVIFTNFRREMIARTLFDILKLWVAAALASKFFLEFPFVVKFGMWVVMGALAVGGIFFCPPKKPKE